MIFLILSLIISTTNPSDFVRSLSETLFSPLSSPVKITRTHLNPEEEELFKEYIYKDDNKIRIDIEYGDETVTAFVYDGKTGFEQGREISETGSLELLLFGSSSGYLSAMDKSSVSRYEGRDVILITGRQGNKLYLDYSTNLPFRYELRNKVISFSEYKTIDGFGNVPFLIVANKASRVGEIIRITDVEKQVLIPANFFSVPEQNNESFD